MADNKQAPSGEPVTGPGQTQSGQPDMSRQQLSGEGIPEKFRGKSPEEIVKMYLDLERSFHQRDKEIEEWKKFGENSAPVWRAILRNPDLYKAIEEEVAKEAGVLPSQQTTTSAKKGSQETKKGQVQISEKPSEADDVLRNQIIEQFEDRVGISKLSRDKQRELREQLATLMAEKRLLRQGETLATVSLRDLPEILDTAWKLYNVDRLKEEGKLEGLASALVEKQASIGSLPSSEKKEPALPELSEEEKKVASRMGLSEEDYAKMKQRIKKGQFTVTKKEVKK